MEPRIQYAQTADGVSIAFWTLGEGMPLVHLPVLFSHVQLEWQIAECRRWYESLAQNRKLVRYDTRGLGLSERNVAEFSPDTMVLDVEAVVDRLGLASSLCWGPRSRGRPPSPTRPVTQSGYRTSSCGAPMRGRPTGYGCRRFSLSAH